MAHCEPRRKLILQHHCILFKYALDVYIYTCTEILIVTLFLAQKPILATFESLSTTAMLQVYKARMHCSKLCYLPKRHKESSVNVHDTDMAMVPRHGFGQFSVSHIDRVLIDQAWSVHWRYQELCRDRVAFSSAETGVLQQLRILRLLILTDPLQLRQHLDCCRCSCTHVSKQSCAHLSMRPPQQRITKGLAKLHCRTEPECKWTDKKLCLLSCPICHQELVLDTNAATDAQVGQRQRKSS